MGIIRKDFFRMTPLDFMRHRTAYQRKQDMALLPLRRLEATLWNVQIAKTEKGKQITPQDVYPLLLDALPVLKERSRHKKTIERKGIMSRDEYLAMMQSRIENPPSQ